MVSITRIEEAPRVLIEGRGELRRLIVPEAAARRVDVSFAILHPGGSPGQYHYHPDNENVFIILRGRGRLLADGREHVLTADDVVFVPAGVPHGLSALGEDPLVLIEICAPADSQYIPLDSPS